ncbi:hypothetical protein ACFS5J_01670, partial [Flavobacterium chuncheonense]
MRTKITLLLLFIAMGFNVSYAQFNAQQPDLRLCGNPPNYYEDYYNCTSNNYTIDDVFLSLTNVNGQPLNDFTCTPGATAPLYIMLNYTSNSNSSVYFARLFADLIIDGVTIQLNVELGTITPGAGQRQLYGPFNWVCGQEIDLTRILLVWKTSNSGNPNLLYDCNTFGKSQCGTPDAIVVTAPLAVQFEYSGCTVGTSSTINFESTTNGGTPPYTYAWSLGTNGPTVSTVENPTYVFNTGSPTSVTLTVTDSNNLSNTYTLPINFPTELIISPVVQGLTCTPGSTASIDLTISGGTPPYTYLWNTGATTEDLSNLGIGTYSVVVTDSAGCTKNYSTTISAVTCCEFLATCPTFPATSFQCYDLLPAEGIITEAVFESLGNGDGVIGDNPCGVIEIVATNGADPGCNANVIRTYTITEYDDVNDNGVRDVGENTILNTVVCNQTILIHDTTPPSITTQASNSTVECSVSNGTEFNTWLNNNGGAVASDACGNVTWTRVGASISDDCASTGTAVVTFRATDDCGNFSETTATFTIQDTTPPSITTQASNNTVECSASNVTEFNTWLNNNGGAVASDVCGNVTWTRVGDTISNECGTTGTATVTFRATDDCGNFSETTATFTIQDTTPPSITTQASNSTVECDGNGNTVAYNTWLQSHAGATAIDNCDSDVSWSWVVLNTSNPCPGAIQYTVQFSAIDDCFNNTATTATFTIQDTTAPTLITQAVNQTVECDGNGNIADLNAWLAANGGASSSDDCSAVTWSNDFTTLSDLCGATGSATVTFTATDDCGNSSTTSATFTIQDTTAPTLITQAVNQTVECDGNGNIADLNAWLAANGGASSSDNCSAVTWSNDFTTLSDLCGATGSATVTFTATDDCG